MVRKICSVRSEDRISAGEVRPDWTWRVLGNVYRIEGCSGWSYVEPSMLVIVSSEDNLGKQ